ncbi:hypothetical protein JCM3766R1_000965 [Sporobolomyces carnicolor]
MTIIDKAKESSQVTSDGSLASTNDNMRDGSYARDDVPSSTHDATTTTTPRDRVGQFGGASVGGGDKLDTGAAAGGGDSYASGQN